MTLSGQGTTAQAATVEEYFRAFNERDLDAWTQLFDPDIEIEVDSFTLRGIDAALGYAEAINATYPGVAARLERIVAMSGDTVVTESRLVNPEPEGTDWYLEGLVCMIFEFRDGRVARLTHYYQPSPNDRTTQTEVPSRAEAAQIAAEQAALRRVATLVARSGPQTQLFETVCREAAQLLGADTANLGRYEGDGTATNVGGWSADGEPAPLGIQVSLEGESVVAQVYKTGRTARVDAYDEAGGEVASVLRNLGIHSSVGTPIVVDGETWGVMIASTYGSDTLPADTEARLSGFTELVATAISNSEAREKATRLAEEHAALRRVATLVAHEPAPGKLFAVVASELGQLLAVDDATVVRYMEDGAVEIAADWGEFSAMFPPGRTIMLEGTSVIGEIRRTGRPARLDDYGTASGPLAEIGRTLGIGAAAGAPIVVDGRVWGALAVSVLEPRTLPSGTTDRIAQFADLTGTAISNVEARAQLAASRARLMAAADGERRRLVRDLHDGAQQALVHTILTLKMAQRSLATGDDEGRGLVAEALSHAERATTELRELSHGIMPSVLTRDGLSAAVPSLAARAPVPVDVQTSVGRLPGAVEATAYFIVAEALTSIAKHAGAQRASVTVRRVDGELLVEVRDDGVGGATATGSGLLGMRDRVTTRGGRLTIDSPPGGGTTVAATTPL